MQLRAHTDDLPELRTALAAALGDDLLALYLDGSLLHPDIPSLASDSKLWLFVRPNTQMQRVREAFFPTRNRHAELFREGPAVATVADFALYDLLFPDRSTRLRREAQLLAGTDLLHQLPEPVPPEPMVRLAHVAGETIRGSALLSRPPAATRDRSQLVRRLHWMATQQASLTQSGTKDQISPIDCLADLHAYLAAQSSHYPTYHWDGPLPTKAPPSHLPGAVALVGLERELIIVMPEVDRPLLDRIDWHAVVELVSDDFTGIMLATPWQLRLAASIDMAMELTLRSFELVWGSDVLAGCQPSEQHVLAKAAELPVSILVEQLPADYVMSEETELGKLIHDAQNTLLKIQLRSEVMARRKKILPSHPPGRLPGRETPLHERVAANLGHFRWWAEHLTASWKEIERMGDR
jgi:hypothetical protein